MKRLKTTQFLFLITFITYLGTSCEEVFLEKPTGNELITDSIFANTIAAQGAIARAYGRSLAWGIQYVQFNFEGQNQGNGLLHGHIGHISGENNDTWTWEYSYRISSAGMQADRGDGWPQCSGRFLDYWEAIRVCYLVMENIDMVSDMSAVQKAQVKGEMKALIAYTYEEMFKRYGGLPIVRKSLTVDDDIFLERSSLQGTIDFVVQMCDEAAAVLPDKQPADFVGRMTKGVALAIKAEILTYAARPLFNGAPYLPGAADSLWSFGSYDPQRWQLAINANQDVLDWAAGAGVSLIDTDNPLVDFGMATSTPGNQEVLLAYKDQYGGDASGNFMYFNPHFWESSATGASYETLIQFRKADGTDQVWAGATPEPFSEYFAKCGEMEPRFKASIARIAGDAENNPGDTYWEAANIADGTGFGNEGVGRKIKFWHGAGTRNWFENPLYRLSEFYLNIAEGYNELGNSGQAHAYLNVIRERGGIPDETITDQNLLRESIQREWTAEFWNEQHRLFDMKHWKIAPDYLGEMRHTFEYGYANASPSAANSKFPADFTTYRKEESFRGFWASSQYLHPFPIGEINKGYLVQNPGY